MLCTIERYQELTLDAGTATGDATQALLNAQESLEDALGRRGLLEYGTHTETLTITSGQPLYGWGQLYPTATPIQTTTIGIADLCELACIDDVIYGPTPDASPATPGSWPRSMPLVATISYIGGYNPAETDRASRFAVPFCIVQDLAAYAFQLLHPMASPVLVPGAVSVTSGDESVTFKDPVSNARPVFEWSCDTMRYRRNTL